MSRSEVSVVLAPHVASVGFARRFVVEACARWRLDSVTAEVVCSELVTNAVRHGDGEITVLLRHIEGRIYLGVVDDSPNPPRLVVADDLAEGGRGLALVAGLSRLWGFTDLGPEGKIVWAELDDNHADLGDHAAS